MVWEVKDPLSRQKSRLRLSPSHLIHHITAIIKLKYCCYGVKQQQTNNKQSLGWTVPLVANNHLRERFCATWLGGDRSLLFWQWQNKPGSVLGFEALSVFLRLFLMRSRIHSITRLSQYGALKAQSKLVFILSNLERVVNNPRTRWLPPRN